MEGLTNYATSPFAGLSAKLVSEFDAIPAEDFMKVLDVLPVENLERVACISDRAETLMHLWAIGRVNALPDTARFRDRRPMERIVMLNPWMSDPFEDWSKKKLGDTTLILVMLMGRARRAVFYSIFYLSDQFSDVFDALDITERALVRAMPVALYLATDSETFANGFVTVPFLYENMPLEVREIKNSFFGIKDKDVYDAMQEIRGPTDEEMSEDGMDPYDYVKGLSEKNREILADVLIDIDYPTELARIAAVYDFAESTFSPKNSDALNVIVGNLFKDTNFAFFRKNTRNINMEANGLLLFMSELVGFVDPSGRTVRIAQEVKTDFQFEILKASPIKKD